MKDMLGDGPAQYMPRLFAALLTLAFAYFWVSQVDNNSAAFDDAQLAALIALGVFVSLFVGGFLINLTCVIPAQVWDRTQARLDEMSHRLTPKFGIHLEGAQRAERIDYGSTSVSWGGKKQTIITQTNEVIRLDVSNDSDISLAGCEAYLARFKKVASDEELYWQSLRLPWLPIDGQATGITIPPRGKRTLGLFRTINRRLQFLTDAMPVKMVHAIEDKGEYEGLIVLTAMDAAPTYVTFQLLCDAPENGPILTVTSASEGT